MTDDNSRPIGNTPITDAASASAPQSDTQNTNYADYGSENSSNADLRVGDNSTREDAAMSATGADIDDDQADERPVNRSDDAPELYNDAQDDDESTQAQTLAGESIGGSTGSQSAEDSEHGGSENPAFFGGDDAQDTVDHMNQMDRSGIIDNDAYRGERNDDDEPDMLGQGGMEPGELDEIGQVRSDDEQYTPTE